MKLLGLKKFAFKKLKKIFKSGGSLTLRDTRTIFKVMIKQAKKVLSKGLKKNPNFNRLWKHMSFSVKASTKITNNFAA